MIVLQVKSFTGNDFEKLEEKINKFLKENNLLTENYLDLQLSVSGVSKKDKDGEAYYSAMLVYRKEINDGQ